MKTHKNSFKNIKNIWKHINFFLADNQASWNIVFRRGNTIGCRFSFIATHVVSLRNIMSGIVHYFPFILISTKHLRKNNSKGSIIVFNYLEFKRKISLKFRFLVVLTCRTHAWLNKETYLYLHESMDKRLLVVVSQQNTL